LGQLEQLPSLSRSRQRRWHFIPYDLDNTFSIRWITPSSGDWAKQNIYNWGKTTDTPLVTRILGVPEFKNRYSYYLNQMLQTFYQNSTLNPLVYRIRQNQTAALPFDNLGITNCKSTERSRYSGDWPNWTYTQYSNSFDFAQVAQWQRAELSWHHGIHHRPPHQRIESTHPLQHRPDHFAHHHHPAAARHESTHHSFRARRRRRQRQHGEVHLSLQRCEHHE
jgi:hypothetical protein